MHKLSLLLISSFVILSGCASNTKYYDYSPQYCYTDETITTENGDTVNSKTVVECTDRPGQQMQIARAGIDKGCKEFWYTEIRYNKQVMNRGVQCEKPDGTWEILNVNGTVR